MKTFRLPMGLALLSLLAVAPALADSANPLVDKVRAANDRFKDVAVAVADGMNIPGNLGTLIRTIDACGADALVLTNRRTRLTHPMVFRASQGMLLTVPIVDFDDDRDAVDWLTAEGFDVFLAGTDDAVGYRAVPYQGRRTAIVVGSERKGLSPAWESGSFRHIAIPMLGVADSLNVSIAASVLLYEARARKAGW